MTFDWNEVQVASHSAQDIESWDKTSKILEAEVAANSNGEDAVKLVNDKDWPSMQTESWGEINRSAWAFVYVEGIWHGGTFDQMRPGQSIKGMNRLEYGEQYACQVPGGYAVSVGEPVAYMLSTPARMGIFGPIKERTEVIVLKYGTDEILWREGESASPPPTGTVEQRLNSLENQMAAVRLKLGKIESWINSY